MFWNPVISSVYLYVISSGLASPQHRLERCSRSQRALRPTGTKVGCDILYDQFLFNIFYMLYTCVLLDIAFAQIYSCFFLSQSPEAEPRPKFSCPRAAEPPGVSLHFLCQYYWTFVLCNSLFFFHKSQLWFMTCFCIQWLRKFRLASRVVGLNFTDASFPTSYTNFAHTIRRYGDF